MSKSARIAQAIEALKAAGGEDDGTQEELAAIKERLAEVMDKTSAVQSALGQIKSAVGHPGQDFNFAPENLEALRPKASKLALDRPTERRKWSEGGILLAMWVVVPGADPQPWPAKGPLDIFNNAEAKMWARNLMARTVMQEKTIASWSIMDESDRAYWKKNQTPLHEYNCLWGDYGLHDPILVFLARTLRKAQQPWRRRLSMVLDAWVVRRAHAKALIAVQRDLVDTHLDLGQRHISLRTNQETFAAIRRWARAHIREVERHAINTMARDLQQALINPDVPPRLAKAGDMLDKDIKVDDLPRTVWDKKVKASEPTTGKKRKAEPPTKAQSKSKSLAKGGGKKEPGGGKKQKLEKATKTVIVVPEGSDSESPNPGTDEEVTEYESVEDQNDEDYDSDSEEEAEDTLINLNAFGGLEVMSKPEGWHAHWDQMVPKPTLVKTTAASRTGLGELIKYVTRKPKRGKPLNEIYRVPKSTRGSFHKVSSKQCCKGSGGLHVIPLALAQLLHLEPCGVCGVSIEEEFTKAEKQALKALIELATSEEPGPKSAPKSSEKPKSSVSKGRATQGKEKSKSTTAVQKSACNHATIWKAMGMKSRTSTTMADGKDNLESAENKVHAAFFMLVQALGMDPTKYHSLRQFSETVPLGATKGAEWLQGVMATPASQWPQKNPFEECPSQTLAIALVNRHQQMHPSCGREAYYFLDFEGSPVYSDSEEDNEILADKEEKKSDSQAPEQEEETPAPEKPDTTDAEDVETPAPKTKSGKDPKEPPQKPAGTDTPTGETPRG